MSQQKVNNCSSISTLRLSEANENTHFGKDQAEVQRMLDDMFGVSETEKERDQDALVRRMMAEMRQEIAEQ